MMKVLSIMAHELSQYQRDDFARSNEGIVDIQQLKDVNEALYKELTQCSPFINDLESLAEEIALIATDYDAIILPIGSPAFMFLLARELHGVECWFSHSERVSEEDPVTGIKVSTFKHIRFILVCT